MRQKRAFSTWFWRSPAQRAPAITLPFVDEATCAKLGGEPTLVADVWRDAEPLLAAQLPEGWRDLDSDARLWLFCTGLAHHLKPYGSGPAGIDLASLLKADALDCSTYGHRVHHLAALCSPDYAPPRAAFTGWHGGAVGNHQSLMVETAASGSLLLDPTLGIAARISFDDLASGTPCPATAVLELSRSTQLASARKTFVDALVGGAFRPSDLLYYFETRDQLLGEFGSIASWPTPGAATWRAETVRKGTPG